MSEIITESFRSSIRSSPTGKRKNGTIFDEIYCALESSENALDRVVQLIAEFHGPWTGGSVALTDFASFVAGKLGMANNLVNQAVQIAYAAKNVQSAISNTVGSSVNKANNIVCAIMPTPLLREFVNRVQKIHPSVNAYIQMNIGTFPYFQQISEDIGQFASIIMNMTSIDPMNWPKPGGIDCLDTNSRLNKNAFLKMDLDIFNLMDNSLNLLNTMFLRSMPKENSMGFLHTDYSKESPIAHGHSFTMDVFNAARMISAMVPCVAVVMNLAQDTLRLVNKFVDIKEQVRYSTEGFNLSMNEGPNGEAITYVVDNCGRPMFDNGISNDITDPTNDKILTAKPEYQVESD